MHAHFADVTHTADGFSRILLQNAGIRRIFLVLHRQMMCHHGRIQAGRDLGCTGDLGTVADDTGNIGQRIVDGRLDLLNGTAAAFAAASARAMGSVQPIAGISSSRRIAR